MASRVHSKAPKTVPDRASQSAAEASLADERQELMEIVLRARSPRDREVLDRFYVREEPAEEICALLGITEAQLRLIKMQAKSRYAALVQYPPPRKRGPGKAVSTGVTRPSAIRLEQVIPIVAHAVAVFGDEQKASHWLDTPSPLLGNRSPVEVLSGGDIQAVDTILTRIEHNIPS
jgi:uncharacterized protein (DUF2384 family)